MNRREEVSPSAWVWMRMATVALVFVACLLARPSDRRAAAQESIPQSVIQLWVMKPDWTATGRSYRSALAGTAFLIEPNGQAMTNSHVLDPARIFPRTFKIIATVGNEFFSARIICASALPVRAGEFSIVSRDVAAIQLVPPEIPVESVSFAGVEKWHAHHGAMPRFTPLRFGPPPAVGDAVRVLGFGFRPGTGLPYEWSAIGTVEVFSQAKDGTALFAIKFAREPEPGHSGSPVLNSRGEVIGMFTWFQPDDRTVGIAISRSALDPACR